MHYKVVVSDIDGTLVDDNQEVVETNYKAIKKLLDKGYNFTFATGRMLQAIKDFTTIIKPNLPAIIYNGAQIVNPLKKEVLFQKSLDNPILKNVYEVNQNFGFNIFVYYNNEIYVEEINEVVFKYMKKDGVNCKETKHLIDEITDEFTKILMIGPPNKIPEFQGILKEELKNSVNLVNSEINYLEILPENVSKGKALKRLSEHIDIPLNEIIAIGDNLNDMELLQVAGLGVATANAHPSLKEIADCVSKSDNNTGSVAEVVNTYMDFA